MLTFVVNVFQSVTGSIISFLAQQGLLRWLGISPSSSSSTPQQAVDEERKMAGDLINDGGVQEAEKELRDGDA
jgi:hypothetical protein